MKNLKMPLLMAAIAVFALSSCNKDKEDPTIEVTAPTEHTEFNGGDMIHVEATFADDVELASYTVEIGDVDGNHIDGFHNDDSGDLTGTAHSYMNMITVPDSLSVSMFYLHFSVTDAEEKTTTEKWMLHFAQ